MTKPNHQENNTILVSVIIPAYNSEKYIEKAIDSALIQEVPLEVIVINDCSPDRTSDVMRKYAEEPRVRYNRESQYIISGS